MGVTLYISTGPTSSPVCLKKSCSNNCVRKLVGLQLELNFLNSIDLTDRPQSTVHFFTDCQPAITAAFMDYVPQSNSELVLGIKEVLCKVQRKGLEVQVHWCPGHMNVTGNKLADKFVKEAATNAIKMKDDLSVLTKKVTSVELKKNIIKKWQKAFSLSE